MAERARIRTIMCSEAGLKSPKGAFRLAFEGNLSAADAIALLEASEEREVATNPAAPVRDALSGRMRMTPEGIIAAAKKARTPT